MLGKVCLSFSLLSLLKIIKTLVCLLANTREHRELDCIASIEIKEVFINMVDIFDSVDVTLVDAGGPLRPWPPKGLKGRAKLSFGPLKGQSNFGKKDVNTRSVKQ